MMAPELIHMEDADGNTPFHALCSNTVSNECELISMYNFMSSYEINIIKSNKKGISGIDILEERVTENNPYDTLKSVKLFYQHIVQNTSNKQVSRGDRRDQMWNCENNAGSKL